MRTNATLTVEPEDKIVGDLCWIDKQPVLRFGLISLMLTWEQLHKVHAECIKLEVTRQKDAA